MMPIQRRTEILKAAKSGEVGRIRRLLAADAALIEARDRDGSRPLHWAWRGQREAAAFLLKAGADVNAQNNNGHWGTTPLHAAAHANEAAVAALLIEHGADVKARDRNGRTPLDHTTFHEATAAAKLLRRAEAGPH